MNKKRKGPPKKLTANPLLKELGDKARADFQQAVDAIPVEDKEEINALKKEEQQEEHFWKGYSNKLKEQIKSENIFEEVESFKTLKNKEKNNFFKRLLKILGF
jgi:hypothetical protein